jgi:hypothetical protein
MTEPSAVQPQRANAEKVVFLPAAGKIVELGDLDNFVWATVGGWANLPIVNEFRSTLTTFAPKAEERDSEALAARLREEEGDLKLNKFAEAEASKDYPYLFSLVAVRLWAMTEAAVREVLVEASKTPLQMPDQSAIAKLKGPVAPFIGAPLDVQAELLADVLWQSVEGSFIGIEWFEAALGRVGLKGSPPTPVREILRELSEVRHCVVHRGGRADRRLLASCPWLAIQLGASLPSTLGRFWLYRTATYWYMVDLVSNCLENQVLTSV